MTPSLTGCFANSYSDGTDGSARIAEPHRISRSTISAVEARRDRILRAISSHCVPIVTPTYIFIDIGRAEHLLTREWRERHASRAPEARSIRHANNAPIFKRDYPSPRRSAAEHDSATLQNPI